MQVKTIECRTPISDDLVRSKFKVELSADDTLSYTLQQINLWWEKPGVVQIYNDGYFDANVNYLGLVEVIEPNGSLILNDLGDRALLDITVIEDR